jgi:hypothetical protein
MANAPETMKFFANGGTIYSTVKTSTLANFVKVAGLAVAVTALSPSGGVNLSPSKTANANISVIEEINRIVAFKTITGTPKFGTPKMEIAAVATEDRSPPAVNVAVGDVMNAVNRLRLDQINATSVYHQYGAYKVPHDILRELVRAAKDADFPTEYLFGIVEKESGFDCYAEPPSGSARGCLQVIDQTWLRLVKEHGAKYGLAEEAGLVELTFNKRKQPVYKVKDKEQAQRILDLRYDVYYAAVLAVTDLKVAKAKIEKNLSARFNDDNLYLPHFMGEDRAEAALAAYNKRPNASASKIFNREAKANPGMFFDGKGRRRVPIDVAAFIKRAQNVILSRSAKYHNVELVAQKNSLDFMSTGNIPIPVSKPSVSRDSFLLALKSRISNRKLATLTTSAVPTANNFDAEFQATSYPAPSL